MDASSFQVPVPNSRKKFILFCIVVIVTIVITTSCILMYDKIQEKYVPMRDSSISGGQILSPLSSNKTKRSVTTATPLTESAITTTLSDVNCPSVLFETPTSSSDEQTPTQTEITSSHVSLPWTSGVTFSTSVQTNATSVSLQLPDSTSAEMETTTEVTPSHNSTPLTSDVSFMTPTQTYTTPSTEVTTLENTPTCQTSLPYTNATDGYPIDCSGFNISVGFTYIHTIYPYGSPNKTTLVDCLSTSDGIWTVIQRRFNGSVDFFRNWNDYKEGFGDVSGEYWLGNDAIHQLTSRSSYQLKVVLKDWDNVPAYAIYSTFRISDECDGYRLTIAGYHGDAGDSLRGHNGHQFSTLDRDNDSYPDVSCAEQYKGGWWYFHCFHSHLNGLHPGGIIWYHFRNWNSIKEAMMMIQQT